MACSPSARSKTMTEEQLAAMHRLLAEYHRRLAKEAILDVVQQYHSDLAQRLSDEAVLIPRRTAIVERFHKREQQTTDDGEFRPGVLQADQLLPVVDANDVAV